MSSRGKIIHYDSNLCVGCRSCEVACKVEHDLPAGVCRVRILAQGPTMVSGELRLEFKRIACMRCPKPPCLKACPTGAIKKRPDGIVVIDRALCTGCRSCAEVCPYGAIEFHPYSGQAEVCDLCAHRLDEGLAPFCVKHCMGGALFFGTREEYRQRKGKTAPGGKAR